LPYVKRLTQLFLGQKVEPVVVGYLTPPRWYWPVSGMLKAMYIPWIFYLHNGFGYSVHNLAWKSPLRGTYRVESFVRNGKIEPLTAEYPKRWNVVAFGHFAQDITIWTVEGER